MRTESMLCHGGTKTGDDIHLETVVLYDRLSIPKSELTLQVEMVARAEKILYINVFVCVLDNSR